MPYELRIPEKPANDERLTNGQYRKGYTPHNKGKKASSYMSRHKIKKVSKNLEIGRRMPKDYVAKALSKPVVALKDNKLVAVFPSSMEAERRTGIHRTNISANCRKERKSAGGYHWYFESDPQWCEIVNKQNKHDS